MQSENTKTNFILSVEKRYGVSYVGFYDLPRRDSVYVFYQENPRTDLGHSNYMGVFFHTGLLSGELSQAYVTNAESITDVTFPAIQLPDGKFIVSRYRHDFVKDEETGTFIDGGLAYTRSNRGTNAYMKIVDGKEVFYANAPAQRDQVDPSGSSELPRV